MRRRARARDGLDAIRSRPIDANETPSITRSVIHRRPPRAIVGAHARDRIDSIEVAVSIARSASSARVNESERRRAYLGDDGGARGDAFLRARGSRRERDQSGVQRQGNHDCVCVTSRVESRTHVIRVIHSRGRAHAGRGDGQTYTVWVRTHQNRQSPIRVHPVIHCTSSHPHPSRSRSRWWWWW